MKKEILEKLIKWMDTHKALSPIFLQSKLKISYKKAKDLLEEFEEIYFPNCEKCGSKIYAADLDCRRCLIESGRKLLKFLSEHAKSEE